MRCGIVLDEVFTRHVTPPGHPERVERIVSLIEAFDAWDGKEKVVLCTPRPALPESILKVHAPEHFASIEVTAGRPGCRIDLDTYTGPDSFETALLAAGSGICLAERLFEGEIDAGFLLCRPPGHHAESGRAMGFCLFNNAAIVAQWVIDSQLASKVAIVDFDVHHGNGTQQIFFSRSDVLYISSHQHPFYPGTGTVQEQGAGEGLGYTVNFPLRAGTGDAFYCRLYAELVAPILTEFGPDLILVSAGFDAHRSDPLGGMLLSADGYAVLASILLGAAREAAGNRLLFILEGGYSLGALTECVFRTIETVWKDLPLDQPEAEGEGFESYAESLKRFLSRNWMCFTR